MLAMSESCVRLGDGGGLMRLCSGVFAAVAVGTEDEDLVGVAVGVYVKSSSGNLVSSMLVSTPSP